MKLQYLIDTDWTIEYLQGKPHVVERVRALIRRKVLALSVVCLAELYEGVVYARDPAKSERALNQFLRGIRLLPLDKQIAKIFGEERGRLRKAKRLQESGDLDLLIAATAIRHDLILLTGNRRHFELVPKARLESS